MPSPSAAKYGSLLVRRVLTVGMVFGMALLGVTVVGGPTSATTPGENGRIVFAADLGFGFQLYTMEPNAKGFRQITNVYGDATAADWSPNGRRIVFQHDFEDSKGDHGQIMIMDADGSNLRRVTFAGVKHQPAFTPDGRHLVYECDCHPQGIFIMRTDGTNRRRLSTNPFPEEGDSDPNVSPDGQTVTFVRHKVSGKLQASSRSTSTAATSGSWSLTPAKSRSSMTGHPTANTS